MSIGLASRILKLGIVLMKCLVLEIKTIFDIYISSKFWLGVEFIFLLCRKLQKLFQEIHYWERLMFEIPHYASEVHSRKEELRILKENVLLVVRDYNRYHIRFLQNACFSSKIHINFDFNGAP